MACSNNMNIYFVGKLFCANTSQRAASQLNYTWRFDAALQHIIGLNIPHDFRAAHRMCVLVCAQSRAIIKQYVWPTAWLGCKHDVNMKFIIFAVGLCVCCEHRRMHIYRIWRTCDSHHSRKVGRHCAVDVGRLDVLGSEIAYSITRTRWPPKGKYGATFIGDARKGCLRSRVSGVGCCWFVHNRRSWRHTQQYLLAYLPRFWVLCEKDLYLNI